MTLMKTRALFTVIFLSLLPQLALANKAKLEAKCTVAGHGPYNLQAEKCLELGKAQAHTNCILKEHDAKVEVQFSFADVKKNANCLAKLKADHNDCAPSECQWQDDTAQH